MIKSIRVKPYWVQFIIGQLADLYYLNSLTFMHRYYYKKHPDGFKDFFTPSPAGERLPTRRANFKVERSCNNIMENLPSVKLALAWNKLPLDTKLTESLQEFKTKIMTGIFGRYASVVNCGDPNCPDCGVGQ